ncbi:hypothetical protein [Bacillus alkalisoli]|uniref:hypothetical protein n=1 Tax=Bacillus alkalisoli TaxID=2011008 RepID=UPI000C23A5EB|nr:hypothetical protein [Bacillus alkalisoli]
MNRLLVYQKVTEALFHHLEKEDMLEEENVTKLNDFLVARERQLKGIVPPYTDEEKSIGKAIIPLDEKIKELLLAKKIDSKNELIKIQKSKKTTKGYASSNQNISSDGMYYDKRS